MKPRKLKSGKWQARYNAGGKVVSAGTYPTKGEAALAAARALVAHDEAPAKPKKPKKPRPTLREFGPVALEVLATKLQPLTLANHERNLRLHLYPVFGDRALKDIRPDDVDLWWSSLPPTGAKRAAYFTLSRVMRQAKKYGHIAVNPCQVEGSSADVSTPRPELPEEGAWEIIGHCSPDMQVFLTVVLGGALRLGEALGLDRRHLDLTTGELLIEQQEAYAVGGSSIKKRTKTGLARHVILPPWALEPLADYLRRSPVLAGWALFRNARGERLGRPEVYREFGIARARVGLHWAHVHDLRATSLTMAMLATGDLPGVMQRAGHGDIRSALRYQKVSRERDAAIAASMGQRIGRS